MGKRRDRRMAALSNTGRRVKLDLFAEPSGDLGGSSAQDEVEGLPNSPSSSGQKPENPLLLLGQYSDDDEDADKESSRSPADASEGSKVDDKNQVEGPFAEGCQDVEMTVDSDKIIQEFEKELGLDSDSLKALEKLDGSGSKDGGVSASVVMGPQVQKHVNGTCDAEIVGNVSSGWKMVLHEESNQYYYWNIETGETSWEVPEVLAQLSQPASDPIYAAASADIAKVVPQTLDLTTGITTIAEGGMGSTTPNGSANADMDELIEEYKMDTVKEASLAVHADHYDSGYGSSMISCLPSDRTISGTGAKDYPLDLTESRNSESRDDHCSHLIQQSEQLLERLKTLESFKVPFDGQDWIAKYVLEVEIRLCDMKSLASHGSRLHPFWLHSEEQLKRLKSAIDIKTSHLDSPSLNEELEAKHVPTVREESDSVETIGLELKTDEKKNVLSASTTAHTTVYTQDTGDAEHITSVKSPSGQLTGGEPSNIAVDVNGYVCCSAEDIDMDVDMEVEEITLAGDASVGDHSGKEQFAEPPAVADDNGSPIPPPPDDEWIPPPPPDAEDIPPPPPDEPEQSYPIAPPTEVGQPLPYTGQYALSYPNANYEFYGHAEITNSNIYGHAEGCQVILPHGSVSYGAVFSMYGDSSSITANNVMPVTYYGVHQVTGPPLGVATVEPSQFQTQSGSLAYTTIQLDQTEVGHTPADASRSALSHATIDTLDISNETRNRISEVPSTSASISSTIIEASATTSVNDGSVSTSSVNTAALAGAAAASVDTKVQSKVLRGKKRTVSVAPSLKSNKKVSSLVNKWKAAKEELQEDEEEEARGALAMLEKKRQREIEEWRAQQIASGEAKENANFQPLGGDWRERVKRKRASQANSGGAANNEGASTKESLNDLDQQPDLKELARGLPSGWQVYWDESSKQIYYGNTITSETTWVKPTR